MPIDWNTFTDEIDAAVEEAANETNDALAGRISSVSRLTDEEIKELFPDPADAQKLAQLMKIVNDSTQRNEKITQIVNNAEEFAGVMLTLLSKFA